MHNHPSGNRQPSAAGLALTKKLRQAGDFLDLPVLDHLIYTDRRHYSFASVCAE
ncbi:JAB domain-containing protein [Hymenobacter coccineus]|uniref:JAB domain-containing protein n=1 Tax=Hymenobacter coccineus TaxID=1908235 RepID=UPI0009F3EBF6|nr:JAB domain-containing protein [Hymenobacter coccineus]